MEYAQLHTDILADPKLMRAARKGLKGLELTPWFIAFAKKANDGGRLTVGGEAVEPADLVGQIPGQTSRSISVALKSLESIEVLIRDDDGVLCFAAWENRQAKPSDSRPAVRERVRKHRELRRLNSDSDDDQRPHVEYVYYARDGDQVKIGRSTNPWSRCSEMQTARPGVSLLAVELGDCDLERKRQQELGGRVDFRNTTRGAEWFPWGEKIEQFISNLAAVTPPTKHRSVTPGNAIEERRGNLEEPNSTEIPTQEEDRRSELRLPQAPMDRLRAGIPTGYHPDLDALLMRVKDPQAWAGELTMIVEGGTGAAGVSYEDLGRAIRDFKLNGKADIPQIALLRAYVKRAVGDRRPPARPGPPAKPKAPRELATTLRSVL